MSELMRVFKKISEYYNRELVWEQVESLFLRGEQEKASRIEDRRSRQSSSNAGAFEPDEDDKPVNQTLISCIPLVRRSLNDTSVLSALLDVTTTIRAIRESSTTYDNTYDCWDQVIKVSPRDGFLGFIYTLVSLSTFDPRCRIYRQLSLAAASVYFLSLTIPGAKGFHIFEEAIISVSLQVFNLVEKIQKPSVAKHLTQQHNNETWVNFTSFFDDLRLMVRHVHFDEYKESRNAIIKKLTDMQYFNYGNGFINIYAANLHGKCFEILDAIVSVQNGDPKETLLKIMKMTLYLHTFVSKPKGSSNSYGNKCEHISDWFIKTIDKFPRIVSEVLEFYIKYIITNPEKGWRTEQMQKALEYAAKYDAALFMRCNASIVDFLSEAAYADEVAIRSRAVDLLSKMIFLESNVDWQVFRHEVSEIPREVYIIKELIDSIRDSNNSIKLKAVQAIQQAFTRGSPNAKKILLEGIKYSQFNDCDVNLPEEPRVVENEIRFGKPSSPEPQYTFQGADILTIRFLHLPKNLYRLFHCPLVYLRRAAILLVETIVKINPLIIFNTSFVKANSVLMYEPTQMVRKQGLMMVDSILSTYPNCYPVIYVWCKIIGPMLNDADPKNIDLAIECFRSKVLMNVRSIDQTNAAEHFMPWVIIRALLVTQSRLYLQNCFHLHLKKEMINQQMLSTVESHIIASNSTEAWVLLNFICGKVKSKEPDALIHCFVSYHSTPQWNCEHNLLLALEVLISCVNDFSYSALNFVFTHLLNGIKNGTIMPQVIGKAFDFLTTIDHRSRENQMMSTPSTSRQAIEIPSQEWVIDLHTHLEEKLIQDMPGFPENRSTYLSYLFSYSEANLQIKQRPHRIIIMLILKYMKACINLSESELELDNDRILNSMILIAGRFSIREAFIANETCSLYSKILKAIDRPPIVNTILVALTDLSMKHTQVVEQIMHAVLEKLSSQYLKNRMETFKMFGLLVLHDQLKLRGSLLLALLSSILDESEKLSGYAKVFFSQYISKKNPSLFQKCLTECPFVLNEYKNFDGLESFTETMIRSPLKGDDKLNKRWKLYTHLMERIEDVHLIMYFGNLKVIAEKTQNDPMIRSPEGVALIRDILFILKKICLKERKDSEQQGEESMDTSGDNEITAIIAENKNPEPTATSNGTQGRRGGRRNMPTMSDALSVLEKSIVFITTISENTSKGDPAIAKSIDELAKAISYGFPNVIQFAQPAEFWSKYRQGLVTSTPKQSKRKYAKDEEKTSDIDMDWDDDDDDYDECERGATPSKQLKVADQSTN